MLGFSTQLVIHYIHGWMWLTLLPFSVPLLLSSYYFLKKLYFTVFKVSVENRQDWAERAVYGSIFLLLVNFAAQYYLYEEVHQRNTILQNQLAYDISLDDQFIFRAQYLWKKIQNSPVAEELSHALENKLSTQNFYVDFCLKNNQTTFALCHLPLLERLFRLPFFTPQNLVFFYKEAKKWQIDEQRKSFNLFPKMDFLISLQGVNESLKLMQSTLMRPQLLNDEMKQFLKQDLDLLNVRNQSLLDKYDNSSLPPVQQAAINRLKSSNDSLLLSLSQLLN